MNGLHSVRKLKEIKSRRIGKSSLEHWIIEGDNFDGLKALQTKLHQKVDIIYIDPPYNTKNNSFGYTDRLNSSSWGSFMAKRLSLAKQYLSDKGAIFISIDDNEFSTLKLICDDIFGKENFVANFIRKCKSGSGHSSKQVAIEFDYMLCYAKEKKSLVFNGQTLDPANDNRYKFEDKHVEHRGKYYLRDLAYKGNYSKSLDYPIGTPDRIVIYPGRIFGKPIMWRWNQSKLNWGIENDYVVFKKRKENWKVYIKQYQFVDNKNQKVIRTIPYRAIIDFPNASGSRALKEVLPNANFTYPKPIELVQFLFQLLNKKDAVILDFFAGSGTTLHATLNQNELDGGKRRCILITNNENGICKEITYERGKRLIEGYTNHKGQFIQGMNENSLKYFKVE
ncbi:MAG: site-specific DNA-methyltransferase [Flavobacteriales bacterium]|nr:site-specific DNA-methyltransferase [Flavobacteriales bacterium]